MRVFKSRTDATVYTPVSGDTFEKIVKDNCEAAVPPITPDEVALFNWGTDTPNEVRRALVELIGVKKAFLNPYKCELDPVHGPGSPKIYLPKLWKKTGLAYTTVHEVKVKHQLPATAVAITGLDKWFLPRDEFCSIKYELEGLKSRAMKVGLDVYASNYCKATATNNGEFVDYTYSDTPDVPIILKSLETDAAERSAGSVPDWKGESEAADGVLKPRAPAKRYINVASSPYTVLVRYYKNDAHKDAMMRLQSFWPQWTGAAGARTVVADSLKIKWTIKGCPGNLQGQLIVSDKDDNVVWLQGLTPAQCANGDQTYDWSAGSTLVAEDKMPYRAQIQIHTDFNTEPGLGLAAMHTEVRLLTHPEIGTHGVDHELEPQVLAFALAPFYNGADPPEDSAKGRKLRLAKAGYHPGPIEDGEAQLPYLQAVKEFQRDHAKPAVPRPLRSSLPPERLKADGTLDPDTKKLITAQAPGRRQLFADDARADITADATLNTSLNVNTTPIIAWLDDRNNYTLIAAASTGFILPNMGLENYRGDQALPGDGKETADAASICRPWLPLEAALPLMKKADTLQAAPSIPRVSDSMRNATGPIRVDWTFRDLAPEYKVATAEYNANRVRSLRYLTTAINNIRGTQNGKDAFNLTTALGGLRGADYYKAPLGFAAESLMPWKAQDDSGVSAVCSVAHDDLGQDEARLFVHRRGMAGVYLHPSIIGGDGYQFRAQVSFRDMPTGATHPNWKVLRTRYDSTKLPQAHMAPIRLWRKDSYRAHVQWANVNHWGAYDVQSNRFYEPGMVHMVQEGNNNDFRATQIYSGASGVTAWRKVVSGQITGGMGNNLKADRYRPASEMTLTDDTIWPWSTAKHLGVQAVPAAGTTLARYELVFQNQIREDTWRVYRLPLVLDLLSAIERDHGLLRGHLVGEFRASPQYWVEKYYCSVCNTDHLLMELAAAGGTGVFEACRNGVCAGTLQSSIKEDYRCDQCNSLKTASITARIGGTACTTPCTGTMQQTAQVAASWIRRKVGDANTVKTTYTCDNCGRTTSAVEAPASVGTGAGIACGRPCPRHGTLQPVAGSRTNQEIAGPRPDLSLPSWGGPLGGLFLDTKEGPRTYWSHEIGHHKHLEHAGDVIENPAQHDRATNRVDRAVRRDPDVNSQKWDRDCIMSYVNTEAGPDQAYFCGKCLLKLRGWKVEGLADPSGRLAGP